MKKRYNGNWYRLAQTTLDYDNLDEYGRPTVIDLKSLLADETIEDDEARIVDQKGVEQEYQAVSEEDVNLQEHQKEEIAYEDQREVGDQAQPQQDEQFNLDVDAPWDPPKIDEDAPDTSDKLKTIQDAIRDKRVLEIRYSPAGRKNRAIDFGKNVRRVIEPHVVYEASNGNTVVTTWDRSVGATRAFIIDRIQNIVYRDEAPRNPFKQRQYVLPSYERGNKMVANTNSSLTKIASELEKKGLSKSAVVVKEVDQILTKMKEAQYVGFQGQAIRNRRCWDNCYRNKRVKTPKKSAQVVWFECWDEYLKSMKDSTSWDKYASIDKLAKDEKWNQKFSEKVKNKIKEGMSIPEAMYDAFNEENEEYIDIVLKQAGNLTELAVALNGGGHRELGVKVAEASNEILKEAQFGGGFEGAWNKVRRYNPFSSKSRAKGLSGDISTRLKRLTQQALQISNKFNTIIQQSRQSGMAEQGYQQQQQQQQQQQRQQTVDKVKAAPGQAFNWLKEKGQQVVNNPAAQQGATALGGSDADIKTAAPVDPAFAQGANDYTIQLRDEFQIFLEDVRNEAASMSQMSTQTEDSASKQSASQAAQRMMQFVQKATPFEQAFNQRSEMVSQSDALVSEMQSFANDINAIQMGTFDETAEPSNPLAGADVDQSGDIEPDEAAATGLDADQSGAIEPDEAAATGLDEDRSGAIEPDEAAATVPPNFSTLIKTIQQDPEAAPLFTRLLSKNSVNLDGMGVLQRVFEQSGVEFNDVNRKKLVQTFRTERDAAKNQQTADQSWQQAIGAASQIRGKRILAKILNKNKGILKN